jgi:2-oxoglutarate dehydrogenase E2 component (dihydrolipoamide succinyltransferase)
MEFGVYEKIIMPKMGESITEGTIIKWLKKEGDAIDKDENIVLISTDKVEAEIPSPDKGFLIEVKYKEGDVVPVGEILGFISDEQKGSVQMDSSKTSTEITKDKQVLEDTKKRFLSPLVKKLLLKYNINEEVISSIQGSGLNNRVTKVDIINFVNSRDQLDKKTNIVKKLPVKDTRIVENNRAINNIEKSVSNDNIVEKDISNLRKKIMENMVKSKVISAHVSTFFKINYSNINTYRKAYMSDNNYKLTYTDFIVASVAKILSKHPYINSEIRDNKLIMKKDINLGVAVSVNNPEPGLLVPVIKDADQLNILGISKKIKDLSQRVRNKKVSIEELSGGSFTITNPGNYGAVTNTPIINQPQVAILGVGTIHKETVVKQFGGLDTIAIGHIGWLCLTFDHRVIDGVTADSFMKDLKDDLENWSI